MIPEQINGTKPNAYTNEQKHIMHIINWKRIRSLKCKRLLVCIGIWDNNVFKTFYF